MFDQKRARKKKSLTDPVLIIPYNGQSLRKDGTKPVNKPSVTNERAAFNLKKEAKTLSAPTGKLNTSNLSISNMIEEQRSKTSAAPTDLPKKPFTKDDLIPLWKSIAHRYKVEGHEPLYQVMIKRDLQQVNETIYFLEVDNQLSRDRLERMMMEILASLRADLQNYDLEITLDISSEQAEETKFLTGKDKFEKLARKNPNLTIFQNRFNLDIDF